MKKSTFVFILILLASNFLDIKPFADKLMGAHGFVGLAALFVWILVGVVYYSSKSHPLYKKKNIAPAYWILAGIFLSMVPAYLYSQQAFSVSLVAYRAQYFWFVIPALLYIEPKEREILVPLTWFSFLYFSSAILRTYIVPNWFYLSDIRLEQMQSAFYDDSQIIWGNGLPLLLFPLYYYCGKVRENLSMKNASMVFLFLIFLFILQNRSSLFIAVVLAGIAFLTSKGKYKLPLVILFAVILFYQSQDVWKELSEETITQLNNSDYNRVKAFNYFISSNNNLITFLFGNGFLSAHSTSRYADQMADGIYNSDLGLVGYWNQYGIIPITVFVIFVFKALFSKTCPFYVKLIGLHILGCALTISYWGNPCQMLWFVFFYYLFIYNTCLTNSNK